MPISLLVLISAIQPLSITMYLPAVSTMQDALGASAAAIGAVLSAFLIASAIGQLAFGPLSDMFGRRPVLFAGLATFVVGSLLCAVAPTLDLLVVGRILQAAGGAGFAISRAIAHDTQCSHDHGMHDAADCASTLGYVTMGMSFAPLVGPAFGGAIADVASWRVIFIVMALFGAASFLIAWVRLVETRPRAQNPRHVLALYMRDFGGLVRLRAFWMFTATLGTMSSAYFAFVAGAVVVTGTAYGLSASAYGLYLMLIVAGYIGGSFVAGRCGTRVGVVRMIVLGNMLALSAIAVAALLAGAGFSHALALFVPLAAMGFGNGLAVPCAVAGAVNVRPQLAGAAAGIAGAVQIGSGAVGSLIVAQLLDISGGGIEGVAMWPVLLPMLAFTGVSLLLSLRLRAAGAAATVARPVAL